MTLIKKGFVREENKQTKNKTTTTKSSPTDVNNKNGELKAVQDKPFQELLMFIVSKKSTLFSGL